MGPDEEQPALADLRQAQSVVEVGDAGGPWEVLEEARQPGELAIRFRSIKHTRRMCWSDSGAAPRRGR